MSASLNTFREREEMSGAVNSLLLLLNIYMDQITTDSKSKVLVIITVIETSILPAIDNHNDLGDIEALIDDVIEKCQRVQRRSAGKTASRSSLDLCFVSQTTILKISSSQL